MEKEQEPASINMLDMIYSFMALTGILLNERVDFIELCIRNTSTVKLSESANMTALLESFHLKNKSLLDCFMTSFNLENIGNALD